MCDQGMQGESSGIALRATIIMGQAAVLDAAIEGGFWYLDPIRYIATTWRPDRLEAALALAEEARSVVGESRLIETEIDARFLENAVDRDRLARDVYAEIHSLAYNVLATMARTTHGREERHHDRDDNGRGQDAVGRLSDVERPSGEDELGPGRVGVG